MKKSRVKEYNLLKKKKLLRLTLDSENRVIYNCIESASLYSHSVAPSELLGNISLCSVAYQISKKNNL